MKRKIPPPTKEQQAVQDEMRELGCIACLMDQKEANGTERWKDYVVLGTPASIHHINDAGRNISQSHCIPLCGRHHQGHNGGPGIHSHPLEFRGRYGTEQELLELTHELMDYFRGFY